jgi:hypothetical protein
MRRVILVVGAVLGMIACSDPVDPAHVYNPPPIPEPPIAPTTWVLEGTVRGDDGVYVVGANVRMVDGRGRIRETTAADSGYFRFTEVSGAVLLVVGRDGYLTTSFYVLVSGNRNVFLMLEHAVVNAAAEIVEGELYELTINGADQPCDPGGWDARAFCKRLKFVAPRSGLLTIDVSWPHASTELDILVLSANGSTVAYSTGTFPNVRASAPVFEAAEYEVRVHAYYSAETFFLRATIPP